MCGQVDVQLLNGNSLVSLAGDLNSVGLSGPLVSVGLVCIQSNASQCVQFRAVAVVVLVVLGVDSAVDKGSNISL